MTAKMMEKIAEAKKMVAEMGEDGKFIPTTYERMRWEWEAETPTWATLKKYSAEAGIVAEDVAYAWHSDGSALAEMCGIKEGTIFHYTVYHF